MAGCDLSRRTAAVLLLVVLLLHQFAHEWHQLACNMGQLDQWLGSSSNDSRNAQQFKVKSTSVPQWKRIPFEPLRPVCLEIVQNATPVSLVYVNVSEHHLEHPHMGAVDENGNPGHIHDLMALSRNPPPFNMTAINVSNICQDDDDDEYKLFQERVFVDLEYNQQRRQDSPTRPKLLCMIYTTSAGHQRVEMIRETWGYVRASWHTP